MEDLPKDRKIARLLEQYAAGETAMRSKATGMLPSLSCASVLFALVLILLALAACSTGHTDCANAITKEDFAKAFQLCKPLAEQGDADAQFNLGVMYASGHGVPQDYAEALSW